jgi:hypothetical protein
MPRLNEEPSMPPWLAGVLGWVLPGLGHLLIGERWRALTIFLAIGGMFLGGLFVGGVRVIDLPGYVEGERTLTRDGRWTLVASPVGSLTRSLWFVPQALAGPATFVAGYGGVIAANNEFQKPTARLGDIGVLYVAVAGMMNLVALLDAADRAAKPRRPA